MYPLTEFGREVKLYGAKTDTRATHLAIAAGVAPGYMSDIMRGKRKAEWLEVQVRAFMAEHPDGFEFEKRRKSV